MKVIAPWGEYEICDLDGRTKVFTSHLDRHPFIPQFDLDEYFVVYKWEAPSEINILDIGYWGRDGYNPPSPRFRETMAEMILGIQDVLASGPLPVA